MSEVKKRPSQNEEKARAPAYSIKYLRNEREHLQGTGASTSFKSIVHLLYLYLCL